MKKILFLLCAILIANAQTLPVISDDIKNIVSEKDVNQIYCLMTKWKNGEFFAALSADVPELKEKYAKAQSKLNAICSAENYKQGEIAINDLIGYGDKTRKFINDLNVENLKDKVNQAVIDAKTENEIYKKQAMNKRKEIISKILDAKIEEASNTIRARKDLIDSKIYVNKLQELRDVVGIKMQTALNNADEEQLNSAIAELKSGWNEIKSSVEKEIEKNQTPKTNI